MTKKEIRIVSTLFEEIKSEIANNENFDQAMTQALIKRCKGLMPSNAKDIIESMHKGIVGLYTQHFLSDNHVSCR